MPQNALRSFQNRLIAQCKAQPARSAILALLILALLGLWIRHFAGGGSVTKATAVTPVAAAAVVPAPSSENLPKSAQALRSFLGRSPALVRRNLFVVKLEHFPTDASRPAPLAPSAASGFWADLAKSMAVRADQEKARHILIQNLQTQASKLNLQGTMRSNDSPRALVDGKLVGEGDVVAGFKILKIEPNRIIVEREGVRLEVKTMFNR